MNQLPPGFHVDRLQVELFPTAEEMGRAAAAAVVAQLQFVLRQKKVVRFIIATGNSQLGYVSGLVSASDLPWDRIECFHMDEYVGISANHPASFRRWLRERVCEVVHPRACHYLAGDAPDSAQESARYAELLRAAPIDVVSLGIGENGHIAFNDPPVADFNDPAAVKMVQLDDACKKQQVGEGHFPSLAAMPTHALTLTIPTLMGVTSVFAIVPDSRKASAVRNALEGPVAPACPASILRRHGQARLFLDAAAAARWRH